MEGEGKREREGIDTGRNSDSNRKDDAEMCGRGMAVVTVIRLAISSFKKSKQNKTKQNKTKQNKTKQNKTKQNKTKQNKTKQNDNSIQSSSFYLSPLPSPFSPLSSFGIRTIRLRSYGKSGEGPFGSTASLSTVFLEKKKGGRVERNDQSKEEG